MKKRAVILFNLGGPDKLDSVRPFLFNLFYDINIIDLPNPVRWLLAKFISTSRNKKAQGIYSEIGGHSPILKNTVEQAKSLEILLKKDDSDYENKVFIVMRYWHPRAEDVVKAVLSWCPDEIFLLPLYPQFSTTTSYSSIQEFKKFLKLNDFSGHVREICCYFYNKFYIESNVNLIKQCLSKVSDKKNLVVLFSAHSLPMSIVDKGDPYQHQVEKTVKMIMSNEKIIDDNLYYEICYQSKVGRKKWLEPKTEDRIIAAGENGKSVMIVPISFVSEHSETLVELDIEYKEIAEESGIKEYYRVPTVGSDDLFIKTLSDLVTGVEPGKPGECKGFARCYKLRGC